MRKTILLVLTLLAFAFNAQAMTGDVNNDGEVNISDVNALIDQILSGNTTAAGDVNADGEVSISDVNALINIILGGGAPVQPITPKEIALDFSDLTEPSESIPDDEDAPTYGDYVENTSWATTVRITFDGDTATVTGNPSTVLVSVKGAHVTVTSAAKHVRYNVTGTTADGSIKFYSERKFQLRLDSVDITNPHGAAINNQCGKSLYVVLPEGTVNTLRDGEAYDMVEGEDQKAALFSEGQILVSGKGQLNVYSVGKHCIASDDYIIVRPGSKLYMNSTSGHGLKAKDYVHLKGGVINMEIAADGCKGINCDSLVYITGGRTTILNSGTSRVELDSLGNAVVDSLGNIVSTGAAGVKADYNITMTGGTLNILCSGNDAKGVNVAQPFLFKGGELNVVVTGNQTTVSPKGVKCDTDCTIQGGAFYSCSPNGKALDVDGTLTIADGYTTLSNTDKRLFEVAY
ncbi:MAG: carbohydrate-binding domain-containing protein [Muribaculaceae bacterium]|nr:carbohydrate-binding domain-containing protein [Muribaculaceae bacterium]